MNKSRLEAFSDGVFAILVTLLVLELKVPELTEVTNASLWEGLKDLEHSFLAYFLSIAVVSMYWLNHHFMFNTHAKTINRMVVLLNVIFLSFLSLMPFSAALLGRYPFLGGAILVYGINMLLVSFSNYAMYVYIRDSEEIENGEISTRMRKQGLIRYWITNISVILGIVMGFWDFYIAIGLYLFPLVFNNVPGLLDKAEKLFGFRIE